MDRNYIYIEPSVMEYQEESVSQYDNKVEKFILQLDNFLDLIGKLKLCVILNTSILDSIAQHKPTIPFNLYEIRDDDLRNVAKTLHVKIRRIISSNSIYILKNDTKCSPPEELIQEAPNSYLSFLDLLLSGCSKKSEITTDIIIKDIESEFFIDDKFNICCEGICNEIQGHYYKCYSYKEMQENNKMKLVLYNFQQIRTRLRYDCNIEAKEDNHHSIFNSKIKSFDSIPGEEKEFFSKLNKLASVKSIHFREKIGTTNKEPCTMYDFKILDCNEKENCRVKAILSLVRRSSKPQGCEVEMVLNKEVFENLFELMKLKKEEVLTNVIKLRNKYYSYRTEYV